MASNSKSSHSHFVPIILQKRSISEKAPYGIQLKVFAPYKYQTGKKVPVDQTLVLNSFLFQNFQEKMYEFEQNKKNNLILYGIITKHPETSESLKARVVTLFKDHLNIRDQCYKTSLSILKPTKLDCLSVTKLFYKRVRKKLAWL